MGAPSEPDTADGAPGGMLGGMANSKANNRAGGEAAKPTLSQRFWTEVRGYAEALVVAFLIVTFVFNTVGVVGSSMRPTLDGGVGSSNILRSLLTGDRVFIPKYDTWLRRAGVLGPYRRGEIVVVREPANSPTAQARARRPFFIKRVVAVPGDRVRIEGGQVIVNGVAVDQGFITSTGEIRPYPVDFPLVEVEDGEVVGMGVAFERYGTTEVPRLPQRGERVAVSPVDDPRVQLYYGGVLDHLAPLPDGVDDGTLVHDLVLPEGRYFVMGDNRSYGGSEDSRAFGPVGFLSIAGRATAVIWPPRRDGEWNWRRLTPPEAFRAVPEPAAAR